jgi:replicative superfamily II helicase
MFIIDNILLAPAKGFLWIVRELQAAAEADALTARLSTLYMQMETGAITQDEFDALETQILDRLDELKGQTDDATDDTDDDDDESDDESDEEDEEDEVDDQAEAEAEAETAADDTDADTTTATKLGTADDREATS